MSYLIPKSSSPHFLTRIFICLILILRASDASYKSKTDNNNGNNDDINQGLTAFFLRDPNDGMCLGSFGFTDCNTESLWLYASRGQVGHSLVLVLFPDSNASCLIGSGSGLRGGPCNKRESMRWVIEGPNGDNLYRVKHVDAGKEMCIVRYKAGGKKDATGHKARLRNSASLLPCHNSYNPESESGYIPLEVVETAVSYVFCFIPSLLLIQMHAQRSTTLDFISKLLMGSALMAYDSDNVMRILSFYGV